MMENNQTGKRRMPAVGKIVLAAALAVGCVLSIAAGLPAQVYNFVSSGTVTIVPGSNEVHMSIEEVRAPIALEDDRLWFEADGQKLDVTGKVDENTPYIYERTDPVTGQKGYVVVGGTVDNFGWAELFLAEDGSGSLQGLNYDDEYLTIDGVRQASYQLSPELADKLNDDPSYELHKVYYPWFQAALDQLNLDF